MKNIQIHHFKDEIINQNTNKRDKTFGTQGLNPGRLGTSPTL